MGCLNNTAKKLKYLNLNLKYLKYLKFSKYLSQPHSSKFGGRVNSSRVKAYLAAKELFCPIGHLKTKPITEIIKLVF